MHISIQWPPTYPATAPFSWQALLRSWWIINCPEFTITPPIIQGGISLLLAFHHMGSQFKVTWGMLGIGLLVWWLSIFVASSMNCLGDYETDRLDESNKIRRTQAIDLVGSSLLWKINLIEIGLASLLTLFLVIGLNQLLLLGFWLLGLILATMYSFEPYKLKRRGLLNPATIVLGAMVTPMLFTYHVFLPRFSSEAIIVIGLYGLQAYSLILVEQLSDYEEDMKTGMTTPCVLYGRHRTTLLALVVYSLTSVAMATMLWGLWTPKTGWEGLVFLLALVLFVKVAVDLLQLTQQTRLVEQTNTDGDYQQKASISLKKRVKIPLWAAFTGLGTLIVLGGNLLL